MQNYCVSNKDGARVAPPLVTAIEPEPETTEPDNEPQTTMADVLHRLERLGVEYFNCNADSTWTQVCTAAGVPKNQRKLYYQYLSHARAEEALQYSSLIATEELTELLKPVVLCPSNIYSAVVR